MERRPTSTTSRPPSHGSQARRGSQALSVQGSNVGLAGPKGPTPQGRTATGTPCSLTLSSTTGSAKRGQRPRTAPSSRDYGWLTTPLGELSPAPRLPPPRQHASCLCHTFKRASALRWRARKRRDWGFRFLEPRRTGSPGLAAAQRPSDSAVRSCILRGQPWSFSSVFAPARLRGSGRGSSGQRLSRFSRSPDRASRRVPCRVLRSAPQPTLPPPAVRQRHDSLRGLDGEGCTIPLIDTRVNKKDSLV